jgi:putative tricarboxylic transport membrane protein
VLNLPLVGMWVRLLTIPYYWMFPAILAFCALGVFGTNANAFDLWTLIGFTLFGYFMFRLGCEPTPFIMGFVLGPLLEEHLRRALIISRGDMMTFLDRPISAALLAVAAILLVIALQPTIRQGRDEVFVE